MEAKKCWLSQCPLLKKVHRLHIFMSSMRIIIVRVGLWVLTLKIVLKYNFMTQYVVFIGVSSRTDCSVAFMKEFDFGMRLNILLGPLNMGVAIEHTTILCPITQNKMTLLCLVFFTISAFLFNIFSIGLGYSSIYLVLI